MAIEISEGQALTIPQASKVAGISHCARNTPKRTDAEGSIRNDSPFLSFQSPRDFATELYFEWRLKSLRGRLLLFLKLQKSQVFLTAPATLRNAQTPRAPFEMTLPFCHFNRLVISLRSSILNGD